MNLRRRFLCSVLALAFAIFGRVVSADTKSGERDAARAAVQSKLREEAAGKFVDRDAALAEVLSKTPDDESARWQAGYTNWKGAWVKFDALANNQTHQADLAAYSEARGKASDTADSQVSLANWCRERGLVDQERTHLTRALVLQPDLPAVRARLGWQRIDGRWYRKEELAEARDREQELREALQKYGALVKRSVAAMAGKDPKERVEAERRLLAINDPAVIPILDRALANATGEAKMCVVSILARMASPLAAQTLSKIAVAEAYTSVGEAAATALRDRPEEQYVPALLSIVSSPIESRFELHSPTPGRLVYQHMFSREFEDRKEQLTVARGVRLKTGAASPRLASQLADQAKDQEARVAGDNAAIEQLNKKVFAVLEMATRQKVESRPDAWWNWWYDRNEVFLVSEKPTISSYQTTETVIKTAPPPPQRRCECLAAGTAVWTSLGPVAIEQIKAGDLVLSQDPETGELRYKPVLQTTVRPPGPIIRIETDRDKIRSSGGHLWWIAGKGWVRSRLLESGMKIRDVTATTEIRNVVDEDGMEPTFNLIVADFHTYFVGAGKVLSHDNSIRKPTAKLIPGLATE